MKKLFENVNGNEFKLAEDHDETNMNNPEEKKEVQIGKEIISHVKELHSKGNKHLIAIERLAQELIDMHSGNAVVKPGTGGALYKPGSVY